MKRILFLFLIFGSFVTYGQNPFSSFVGEYEVESYSCTGTKPFYDTLVKLVIVERSPGLRARKSDRKDLFIEFYHHASFSSRELNLSFFRRLIKADEDGAAIWSSNEDNLFSIRKMNELQYEFINIFKAGEIDDECVYTLKLKEAK